MTAHIVTCHFKLEHCANKHDRAEKVGGYKVYLDFILDDGTNVTRKLTITKETTDMDINTNPPVYDVYSYNGKSSSTAKMAKLLGKHNFSNKVVAECQNTINVFNNMRELDPSKSQVLFVLDLKDPEQRYDDEASIQACEQHMLDFFRTEETISSCHNAKQFKTMLSSASLQYILLEGSLKAAILKSHFLSAAEKKFLQDNKEGRSIFCQITEFFLHAFKRGEKVTVKSQHDTGIIEKQTYKSDLYLKQIDKDAPPYAPTAENHTVYPQDYHAMATTGKYTSALQQASMFHTQLITTHPHEVVEFVTTSSGVKP